MRNICCLLLILLSLLLSGCWDSVELDESIMVVGIGVSKEENEYKIILEVLAPSDVSPTEEAREGKGILLKTKSKTLFNAARDIIRIAKRRLFFTHAEVWVIHTDLAMDEDMLLFLDVLRREQMLRLNSFLFISDEPPEDIFTTDYTFSNILSEELLSGVEYAEYVSGYPSVRSRDFFKMMLSPIRAGYLPTIKTIDNDDKTLSKLTGAAIFKEGKMVGNLDPEESFGLMWLNDEVQGGSITIEYDDTRASFKLIRGSMDINTQLSGDHLTVDIDVKAEGTLADQNIYVRSINDWVKKFEGEISQRIKEDINKALHKLQKEYKTDATLIGINTYRKQSKQFNQVKDNWDDIFSEATVNVKVDTKINDKGLIESPGYHFQDQRQNKLYQFKKKEGFNGK